VCTPLIAALRDAGHQIGIALSDRNAGIFNAHAFIAQHVLERIPWPKHGSTLQSSQQAASEIAACAYDVALIVSEEPEAFELARAIPQRTGFVTGWGKPLKSLWVRRRVTRAIHRAATGRGERAHEAEIIFRLGAGLHRETLPPQDVARLRPLLMANSVAAKRTGIVVQLGAKWRAMGLDSATAHAMVAMLAYRGARFIASPAEADAAAALSGAIAVDVLPNLDAWKRCIDAARTVVTPDTGAAHLAGMLGVPVIDIFPDADSDANIVRWHPWASPYAALTVSAVRASDGVARMERALDAY
jgi:ADP-heptose:LPS heptosyltransferase